MKKTVSMAAAIALVGLAVLTQAQDTSMSFFISSVGLGNGADVGGLTGADAHCQMLAAAGGAGNRTWRAYLSTTGPGGVNARDRIGSDPWHNAAGVMIADSVDALHSDAANIDPDTGLDENGNPINSEGAPNRHDILTCISCDVI